MELTNYSLGLVNAMCVNISFGVFFKSIDICKIVSSEKNSSLRLGLKKPKKRLKMWSECSNFSWQ